MKLLTYLLSIKAARQMKAQGKVLDKAHQLQKVAEEEQELKYAKRFCGKLHPAYKYKNNNFFKWFYKTYIKGTIEEERADCFIAWSNLLNTEYPARRARRMAECYCLDWEDVRHILLKLRYNLIREDWKNT